MNPAFELEQIERYIDYLTEYPEQLDGTVESHFFPVLQRIFFREGFEVKRNSKVFEREFPFVLIDLDSRRSPVAVDFRFQRSNELSVIPSFVYEWVEYCDNVDGFDAILMLIRNAPLHDRLKKVIQGFDGAVRFLDFVALKSYASNVFRVAEENRKSRAVVVVFELIESLIRGIAEEKIALHEVQWFDLERIFHRIIEGFGFHAHLTPSAKDGGRDVLACEMLIDDVTWYNIEIKHWKTGKPGKREVASFLDTSVREGRKGALFYSTYGVTDSAISLRTAVNQDFLRFADKNHLIASCKHYARSDEGIWRPFNTLREFIYSESF